jgi:hypothetical protein
LAQIRDWSAKNVGDGSHVTLRWLGTIEYDFQVDFNWVSQEVYSTYLSTISFWFATSIFFAGNNYFYQQTFNQATFNENGNPTSNGSTRNHQWNGVQTGDFQLNGPLSRAGPTVPSEYTYP